MKVFPGASRRSQLVMVCFVFFINDIVFVSSVFSGKTAAFMSAVQKGQLRPHVDKCQDNIVKVIQKCWDGNPSSRPCLSFLFINPFPCVFMIAPTTAFDIIVMLLQGKKEALPPASLEGTSS